MIDPHAIAAIWHHIVFALPLVGLGGGKKTTSQTYPPWLTNESQQEFGTQQQAAQGLQSLQKAVPLNLTPQQTEEFELAPLQQLGASYGTARNELMRRAAATGSQAALPETLSELGRSQAQQGAQTELATQAALQNIPVQRAMAKASMYQPLLGLQPPGPYPQTQTQTTGGTIGSTLSGILSPIIGAGVNALAPGAGLLMSLLTQGSGGGTLGNTLTQGFGA